MKKILTSTLLLSVSLTSNAALEGRLAATPGGTDYQAYYDTEANLTWLADANAAVGSAYDTVSPGTGRMNWADANAWVGSLVVGGVGNWRLPNTIDVGNDGLTYSNGNYYTGVDAVYNMTTHSEMSNMWYNVLGNLAYCDTSGNCPQTGWSLNINAGPFSNLQANVYWSATEYAPYSEVYAWVFGTGYGDQFNAGKNGHYNAWAVQSGDVSAVPVPSAVWLLGSGLVGLIGVVRKQSRAQNT